MVYSTLDCAHQPAEHRITALPEMVGNLHEVP